MPRTWMCPYWVREEKRCIVCQAAQLRFISRDAFSEFARRNCASITGWRDCALARFCTEQYEKSITTTTTEGRT